MLPRKLDRGMGMRHWSPDHAANAAMIENAGEFLRPGGAEAGPKDLQFIPLTVRLRPRSVEQLQGPGAVSSASLPQRMNAITSSSCTLSPRPTCCISALMPGWLR